MATTDLKTGGLLFINQDEKTLSKNKHVNTKLRAHIMNNYARKKALAGIQRLKRDATTVDSFMRRKPKEQIPTTDASITQKPTRQETHLQPPILEQPGIDDPSSAPISQGDDDAQETSTDILAKSNAILVRQNQNLVSPTTYHNGGANDPFFCSALPIDTPKNGLCQHFVGILTPFLAGKEGPGMRVKMVASAEVQTCLGDADEMWSILAMASAHEEALRRGSQPWFIMPHEKSSLYYQTKCIQAISGTLARGGGNVGVGTIRSVMRISYAEAISGRIPTSIVHTRAAFDLVRLRGGIYTIDLRMREKIAMMDIKMAVPYLSKPDFELASWDPGDLPESAIARINPVGANSDLITLGDRLIVPEAESSTVIHPKVRLIFADLRLVVHMAEYAALHIHNTDWSDLRWMTYKTLAVEHRFLSIPFDPVLIQETTDIGIQSCIRIAALLYTNTTLLQSIPLLALRVLVPRLKAELVQSDLSVFWTPFADMLLWVLCMGAYLAAGTEEEQWFLQWMTRTGDFLVMREWEEVEALLVEFFYLRKVHGPALKMIWGKVKERLKSNEGGKELGVVES
jgi:hypothetical protein